MDFDNLVDNDTFGLEQQANCLSKMLKSLTLQALQHKNKKTKTTTTTPLNLKSAIKSLSIWAGYEVLEGDDNGSFATPLATAHKFQGFADRKFLTTPNNGSKIFTLAQDTKFL